MPAMPPKKPTKTPAKRSTKRAWITRAVIALVAFASPLLADAAVAVEVFYLAFGDSVTAAWGFDEACGCESHQCRQACGYPVRLKRRLVNAGIDAAVINEGLGGEKTAEGLTRIENLLAPRIDVLLLMEGTNDVSVQISPETTAFNLAEMARKAADRGIETVHATLIPRYRQARRDARNVVTAELAGQIRELAFVEERTLADPFEVFAASSDIFNRFYAEVENDPVGHPNAKGFDVLAEVFFHALLDIDDVAPVVGLFEPAYDAVAVAPLSTVRVRLHDFGAGLDPAATELILNGARVTFQSTGGSHWQELVFEPTEPLPAETTIRVASRDLAGNSMNREVTRFTVDQEAAAPCVADATTLCIDHQIGDGRFQLTLTWNTALNGGQTGDATAVPLASIGLRRGGLFSFFDVTNPEVLVKVLDGCAINGRFWVFVAPTTTVGYELRVVDTLAAFQGAEQEAYEYVVINTDGRDAPPVSDTGAFATCDFVAAPPAGASLKP